MRTKTTTAALVALAAVAGPASAGATKPKDKPAKSYCSPKKVGYNATGALKSSTLTQTAGADTKARGDDRYSGDLVVTVTKTNHKSTKGEQTFTLQNARVRFHPKKDTVPAAGDRVKVHGSITKLGKGCDTTGFTPTVTVRRADVKAKKAAKS